MMMSNVNDDNADTLMFLIKGGFGKISKNVINGES